jgi:MFS family permease
MNKVTRALILSDLFILSSFGLIQPIFSILILKNIPVGSIAAAGIAVTVQTLIKALFQIPISKWTDEERGNCRELYTLIMGSIFISITPALYSIIHSVGQLYLVQIIYGLGLALSFPSWRVIFSRYLNQDHAGYEYSLYDTTTSLGIAATASIGAYFAQLYSFQLLFAIGSVFSFVGTAFLVTIFKHEFSCRIDISGIVHREAVSSHIKRK